MTDRIVDIGGQPLALSARNGLLILHAEGGQVDAIPFGEIAAVVASHRQVTVTQAALSAMAAAGAVFISCDAKMMPASMLLPIDAHFAQTERFIRQAALTLPRRKRFWQAIVREKIRAQASVLARLRGTDGGLTAMARRVRSGDAGNLESQAARRYWLLVFDDPDFRRGDDGDPRNALLNYGYAVVRAATSRALCAAGLHPSFGLHHANKLNPFVLADDLMEPWRPAVDFVVAGLGKAALDTRTKQLIIGAVTARYRVNGENRTLFDILARTAQSLMAAIEDGGHWGPPSWFFDDEGASGNG
jgi:CRISP-associated protein Cas1